MEFFVGEEQLYVMLITQDTCYLRTEAISAADLHQQVDSLLRLIQDPIVAPDSYQALSRHLYELLLGPSIESLGLKELIIIPDGRLGHLPFEVLKTPADQYLVEAYELRYEYSATVLGRSTVSEASNTAFAGFAPDYAAPAKPPRPDWASPADSTEGHWMVSLPASTRQSAQQRMLDTARWNLGPLRYSQSEVDSICGLVRGVAFLGEVATEATFKEEAGQFGVLHLAMHGLLNDQDPLYSALVFRLPDPFWRETDTVIQPTTLSGAEAPTEEDGMLYAYELYGLRLQAQMAVLSACETGIGKYQRGEGVMSLARAFKYAGCPNVVMSLWKVDDASTQTLMLHFYRHLKAGMEKDAALRQAKLDYLAEHPRATPYEWAAFVMIGDDAPLQFGQPLTGSRMLLWLALGVVALLAAGLWFLLRRS